MLPSDPTDAVGQALIRGAYTLVSPIPKPYTWCGKKPWDCDLCGNLFGRVFYDASLRGQWGMICELCFTGHGCETGTGRGQKYVLEGNNPNLWRKVAG